MNLSRAYSLAYSEELSVGRVQTPTLAMLVERELAIRSFVPEDYLEIVANFRPTGGTNESTYPGTWFRARPEGPAEKEALQKAMRLPVDGDQAKLIIERARNGKASIDSVEARVQHMAAPLLYDLTELQRHANRLFGFSARRRWISHRRSMRATSSSAIHARITKVLKNCVEHNKNSMTYSPRRAGRRVGIRPT
jgi:DNA topoisomerase-3